MPGRPWWRSRAFMSTAAAVVVIAVVVAAFTALHHGGTGSGGGGGGTLTAAVKPPGCTTAAPKAKQMSGVRTQNASVGGKPFGVAITADGKYSFISTGNDVVVLNNRGGSLAPAPVATIPAQGAKKDEAITPDGKYLLAAAGSGAYVISVAEAEAGDGGAVLGTLTSPHGAGAAGVEVSPDNRYAFVTLQDSAEVAVFDLRKSLAEGFGQSGLVGTVPVGQDPVGIAQSPDGRWLYVAQEGTQTPPAEGRLYVLSASRAETDPGKAVQTSAVAGCGPAGSSCPATATKFGSRTGRATRWWRSRPLSCSRNRSIPSSPGSMWGRTRSGKPSSGAVRGSWWPTPTSATIPGPTP